MSILYHIITTLKSSTNFKNRHLWMKIPFLSQFWILKSSTNFKNRHLWMKILFLSNFGSSNYLRDKRNPDYGWVFPGNLQPEPAILPDGMMPSVRPCILGLLRERLASFRPYSIYRETKNFHPKCLRLEVFHLLR